MGVSSFEVLDSMTFSSTIIGLKLLPTTVLHHQRTGEIMISILLLQDLAIVPLLIIVSALSRAVDPDAPTGLTLVELAPGVSREELQQKTGCPIH